MNYHHIIWDFDGTLFDTYPALNLALRRALAEFGVTETEDAVAGLLADTLSGTVETLCARHGLDQEAVVERFQAHHSAIPLADRPPFPGALTFCAAFQAAGGHNYIVTHRGRESLLSYLSAHDALPLYDDLLTGDQDYPRKPDPASFLAMIERHALPLPQTLAVGDRALDVLAGQGAGVATCLFGGGPLVEPVTPTHTALTFAHLPGIVGLDGA